MTTLLTTLQLKQAGFSDDAIVHWVNNQRPLLKNAGFSDMEINNAYGIKPTDLGSINTEIMNNESNVSINENTVHTDGVTSLNNKNTVGKDKSIDTINSSLDKDYEKIEKLKLPNEDKTKIKTMLQTSLDNFKGDDKGRVGFEETWLNDHYPDITLNDIKFSEDKDVDLLSTALNDKQVELLQGAEAKDILNGNIGYNSKENKFVFSKEYEDEIRPARLKQKEKELIEGVKKQKYKLYVLNTPLTTGQESRKVLNFAQDYYGANEQQLNNFNTFISYVSTLESDNRNIYSRDGEAKGLFQFRGSSAVTGLNRFKNLMYKLDKDYQIPKWLEEAYEHKDFTALTPDQQRAVTLANFIMIGPNKTLNRAGTDDLIKRIMDGDVDAMKELYKSYHHADWYKDETQGKYVLRDNEKLDKRIDDHFKYWGTQDVGYMNPQIATWPSDWMTKEGQGGKFDNFVSYYMGGQGAENAFRQGYYNSVTGLFDRYVEWTEANPLATIEDKEDKMKEMFMYNDGSFGDAVISSAVQLVNDSPYMIAGCFATAGAVTVGTGGIAAPAAPVVCMGGAFALPEALRHPFTEGLLEGKWNNFSEFMDHFLSLKNAEIAGKMGAVGMVTGAVGKVAEVGTKKYLHNFIGPQTKAQLKYSKKWSTANRLGVEVYAMTELGARVNGHTPTMEDFAHTAVLIFGFHATIKQVNNLVNLYKKHAVHPKDVQKLAEVNKEVKDQLKKGEIPDVYTELQKDVINGLEKTTNQKILPEPKFKIGEKININVDGTRQGIVVSREVSGNETLLIVKDIEGNNITILESQARKTDPVDKIQVKINEKDGSLEITKKEADANEISAGSKDGEVSFKSKQEANEFSPDIIELQNGSSRFIKNKDGTTYKSTAKEAVQETSNNVKEKFISEDGAVETNGIILTVKKFYPEITKEKSNYEVVGKYKTAMDLINKTFDGVTNKYKRISMVFAGKKGLDFNVDSLVAKIGNDFISIPRKAYEQLMKFNDNGTIKQAKVAGISKDKPLVFLDPVTNEIVAMLKVTPLKKGERSYSQAESYWNEYSDYRGTGNFHYSKRTRDSDNAGIPDEPWHPSNRSMGTKDNWKQLFESSTGLDYFNIVTLVESLLGKLPKETSRRTGYLGVFRHLKKQDPNIPLRRQAEIEVQRNLQENPADFLKTLTHELGHLIDFVPDRSMKKGNILGHIANFKSFLNKWIDGKNEGNKPLDRKEIAAIKKQANELAKSKEKETNKEIETDLKITPDKILQIFTDPNVRNKIDPEFYDAFAKLGSSVKKEVVKDAMKGMLSHHIKAIADKVNGKKVDPRLSDEANTIFKNLFEAELKKRNLVSVQEIRAELKALSMKWHPWNRATAPKKYAEYRDSPSELMAEFMMALLLRPQWTKFNAPKSFDLLMYHMKNRPEVMDNYITIQNLLNAPVKKQDAVKYQATMDMFMRGDKQIREAVKDAEKTKREALDDIGTEVLDNFWWMLQHLKLDSQRGNSPLAKDVRYYIENYRYRWAEGSLYKRMIEERIIKQIHNLGYNKNQFGYTLLLKNLAESQQREGKITWKFYKMPKELEQQFKKEEGDIVGMYERWAMDHPELVRIANEFAELRQTEVVQAVANEGVISPDIVQQMKDNTAYIKYQPIEVLIEKIEKMGKYVLGKGSLKKTKGTFSEFANPFDFTVAADMQIMAEVKKHNTYYHIVEFLKKHKTALEEASGGQKVISKPKYIGKGVLDPNVPTGLKRIQFMRNGKMETFDIHRGTAEAMGTNPLQLRWTVRWLAAINSVSRAVLTEHNPLFWIWNWGFRDMRRSFLLLPNGKVSKSLGNRIKYVKEVFASLPDAWKSIYGDGTAITRHMEKNGFLIAAEEGYRSEAGMGRSRLTLDEDSFALKKLVFEKYEQKGKFGELWDGTMGEYLRHSGNVARILERSHKIAGYKVIKDQVKKGELKISEKELMQIIQSQIGSPNFLRQGKMNPVLNQLMLFYNANKEGYRGDIEAFKRDKSGVASRFFLYSVAPKVFEKMIQYGFLGSSLAVLYNAIPDHDRDNFNVVLIGKTEDNRPVYIRFPMDFTSQLITSIFGTSFDMIFGINKDLSSSEKQAKFWETTKSGLPQISPFLVLMSEVSQMVLGQEVRDRFGNPIFDPLIQKMDWLERDAVKLQETLKHVWNTNGPSFVHKFKSKFKKDIAKEYTNITGFPLIDPLIERFLKVGENPVVDEYYNIKNVENRLLNLKQYDLRTAIDKIATGKIDELTANEKQALVLTPQLANNTYFIENISNAAEISELLQIFLTGDTKDRAMALKAMKKIMGSAPDLEFNFKITEEGDIIGN